MSNLYCLLSSVVLAGIAFHIGRTEYNLPVEDCMLIAFVILLFGALSDYMIQLRDERVHYGQIIKPILVADWGSAGKSARSRIPEHLKGNVIFFVPARKVRQTEERIIRKLKDAENRYYCWPEDEARRLPVLVRFFRDPKFGDVNESADEYLEELFNRLAIENQTFLSGIRENSTDKDFERLMFVNHRNGSVWND